MEAQQLVKWGLSNAIFILTLNKRRWRLVELKGGQIERKYTEEAVERHCMETVWECYETETDGQKYNSLYQETPQKKGNGICQTERRVFVGARSLDLDIT